MISSHLRFRLLATLAVTAVLALGGFLAPATTDAQIYYDCTGLPTCADVIANCSGTASPPWVQGPCTDFNGDFAYVLCEETFIDCRDV